MALVNFIFGIHKNRHTLWARLFPGAEQFLQQQRKGERSLTQCSVNEDWGPQAEEKRECKYVISMFVLGAKATNRMEDTVGWAVLAQPHRTTFLPSSPFPEEWVSTGHSRHWTDSPSGTCGYRNPSVNLPCVRLSSWTWLVHIKEILKHSSRKISPLPVNRSIRHRSTCNMDSSFALFFFPSPAQDAYGTVTTTDCERNSDLHTKPRSRHGQESQTTWDESCSSPSLSEALRTSASRNHSEDKKMKGWFFKTRTVTEHGAP